MKRTPMISRTVLALGVLALPFALTTSGAHAQTASEADLLRIWPEISIDFAGVPAGTSVNGYYSGVTLSWDIGGPNGQPVVTSDPLYAAPSHLFVPPPQPCTLCLWREVFVVTPNAPPVIPWFGGQDGAIQATFAKPRPWVSITATASTLPEYAGTVVNRPYMTAFDPNGNYLGEVVYPYAFGETGWGTFQVMTYTAPSGQEIGSVLLSTQQQGGPPVIALFTNLEASGVVGR
jgi:hypothetical protein